jgi:hypothetical protein
MTEPLSRPRFDADELVASAIAATGLADFGEPTWREGLDLLLAGMDDEAQLNDVGRVIVETDVAGYLGNRLGIVQWRKDHPTVAERPIVRPIFIVGQPRTGTTILYDLLAQDPANRAPLTWEVDRPLPPPSDETWDDDPRIAESQAQCEMADLVVPGFTDFHPLGARFAQECVRITGSEFRSMIFPVQFRVPTYNRWLLHEADMAPAYRWHHTFLQHLQSGHMTDRWLLKSPAHLWCLGDVLAQYPDALIIQTHRDPLKVVASVSALSAHLRRMASDHSSVAEAAEQYVDDIYVGLDRSIEAREDGTVPAEQIVDVHFTDFMDDPFTTIATLYDRLGIPFTDEVERRMRTFLSEHPGDGGGTGTRYRFADTGLDAGELRERAERYQRYFDVVSEPVA